MSEPRTGPRRWGPAPALVLVVCVLVMCVVALGGALMRYAHKRVDSLSCHKNLIQAGLSLHMYAHDYGGRFPPDAWCDHVLVYSRARFVFTCPLLPDASGGYAFNEALRGRSLGDVGDPATTPLLFDGPRGWNVYAGPGDVRAAHGGGWQVVYVDSYVRWRSSEDVDALQWNPQSE